MTKLRQSSPSRAKRDSEQKCKEIRGPFQELQPLNLGNRSEVTGNEETKEMNQKNFSKPKDMNFQIIRATIAS